MLVPTSKALLLPKMVKNVKDRKSKLKSKQVKYFKKGELKNLAHFSVVM